MAVTRGVNRLAAQTIGAVLMARKAGSLVAQYAIPQEMTGTTPTGKIHPLVMVRRFDHTQAAADPQRARTVALAVRRCDGAAVNTSNSVNGGNTAA